MIAHIASPNSVKNIKENNQVCLSFIEAFVQKGFKVTRCATITEKSNPAFAGTKVLLTQRFGDDFPITAIITVTIMSVTPIIAPGYIFYPNTTEREQVETALKTYRVQRTVFNF